jgi:hypothetical protein
MATIVAKKLFGGTLLTTTQATVYTVPGTVGQTRVTEILLANQSTLDQTPAVHFVAAGSAASTVNRILPAPTLGAGELLQLQLSSVLGTSDFISVIGSSAGQVMVYGSGAELTT